MLITKSQIDELLEYRFNDAPVTSLYLNVNPSGNTKEEYTKNLKTLLRENKEKLSKEDFSRNGYYSVIEDFEKITRSVEAIKGHVFRGLAVFSSSKNNFLQTFELDEPVNDRLVVDYFPYTKPLFTVLRMKKRYLALLFKKDKLRALEVYGEKIKEDIDLFNRSYFSSRSNDYIFINEKKYQNRLETEYHKFLREASNATLNLLMEKGADHVVLGGDRNTCADFLNHMHSYLHERYAGCIDIPFSAKESVVLKEVRKINERIVSEKDREIADRIRTELAKNSGACKGVGDILRALSMAAVSTMVVEEGYVVPGFIDMDTGLLYLDKDAYSSSGGPLMPVKDVINEAVDEAIHQGAEVRIVKSRELLKGLDHIAALLRFTLNP
jgi:hypothetical protein